MDSTFKSATGIFLSAILILSCHSDPWQSAGLDPMTFPNVAYLESDITQQIQTAQSRVTLALSSEQGHAIDHRLGELGRLYLLYGLYDDAIEAFKRVIVIENRDPKWFYYLGHAYQQQGEFVDAANSYRSYNAQTQSAIGLVREAEVLVELGQRAEAASKLERALEQDSTLALAHFLVAQIQERNGALEEAVRHYETVLKLQPDASIVHHPLGRLYQRLGNTEKAENFLNTRARDPIVLQDALVQEMEALRTGSEALAQEGLLHLRRGRISEAIRVLSSAVQQNPDNLGAQLDLGAAFLHAGLLERAYTPLQEAIRLDHKNDKAYYLLGIIAEEQGNLTEALVRYETAASINPTLSDAFLGVATVYWKLGDCPQAIPNYNALLRIEPAHPDHIEARLRRTMCLSQSNQSAEALTFIENDVATFPDALPLINAQIRVLAASPDQSVRDGNKAVLLAEALTRKIKRPEYLSALAMAYAEIGQFEEAITTINHTLRMADKSPEVVREYFQELKNDFIAGKPSREPWPGFVYLQHP